LLRCENGVACCNGVESEPGPKACTDFFCPEELAGGLFVDDPFIGATCHPCPDGWQMGSPRDLCCRSRAGTRDCFSQMTSMPETGFFPACYGAATGERLDCKGMDAEGHAYSVHCRDRKCACAKDGRSVVVVSLNTVFDWKYDVFDVCRVSAPRFARWLLSSPRPGPGHH
jgi:hypothetical protein